MPYEWIILGLLGVGIVLSFLQRVIWLAIVIGVIALLVHFGAIEWVIAFVRETLLHAPPISVQIG